MKNNFLNSKKAAMEMSTGTIVTIVLSMVVLVLGIFFIQQIFGVGTEAVDSIDGEIQNQIQQFFSEENAKIAIQPNSRRIELDQGSRGSGFALSIRNDGQRAEFTYETKATDTSCPERLSKEEATSYVFGGSNKGSPVTLLEGGIVDPYRIVSFNIPESAPLCDIQYVVEVLKNDVPGYASADLVVTVR
ncbi:MAG: hypothetical protein WDZ69_01300 [Candidatus Pacearchaeota archaeon]